MKWKEVQALRKQGDLSGAKKLARELLEHDAKDFRTRSELEWAIYFEVKPTLKKALEAVKDDKRPQQGDLRRIDEALTEFTRIPPERPGMACSVLLGQLCGIGPDYPRFAAFVDWVGVEGLRDEDRQSSQFDGGQWPALVVQVARALVKWVKARADARAERLEQALQWLDTAQPVATGDDALWLNWDRAGVLRRLGRHAEAAEALSGVIKAKRNEFWVWAEAGRLYRQDDPDLALACFCHALECPADAEFVVKVRRELAELLAERGEHAQASLEITAAAAARNGQGWGIGKELEGLMREPWYTPETTEAQDPKQYYAEHSAEALTLCFDTVDTQAATYLGLLMPAPDATKPDRKPRPRARFAVIDKTGRSLSIVGPHLRKAMWKQGQPLSLVIGRQQGQQGETIVQVVPRPEGEAWDCTLRGTGVVVRQASPEGSMQIFAGEEIGQINADRTSLASNPIAFAQSVHFRVCENPKNGRSEAFAVIPGPAPNWEVKELRGLLRRAQEGGFAFIDDAFVPPQVLKNAAEGVVEVVALAIYAKKPKKEEFGWRVVGMKSAH